MLDTGSYERLPPIPGNDLPGVVGLAAAERYGDAGALRPGLEVAVWAAPDRYARARSWPPGTGWRSSGSTMSRRARSKARARSKR